MVRPHNKNARRRYHRELQQSANPAGSSNPSSSNANPVNHPANLNASHSEAALFQPRPPTRPNAKKQKQKNTEPRFVQYVYINCTPTSIPGLLHNLAHYPPGPPSTFSWPTKQIPALMSLQLAKPAGYSSPTNHVQGTCQKKAVAAQADSVKASTSQGTSQNKASAPQAKAKVVKATQGTSQNKASAPRAKAKVVKATQGTSQIKASAPPVKAEVANATQDPTTLVSPFKLVLWGSSHLTDFHGLPPVIRQGIQFVEVLNRSEEGEGITAKVVEEVLVYLDKNPDPNQIFVFLYGGNNLRDAKRGIRVVCQRFLTILGGIQKIGARMILCGLIPDPLFKNLDMRFLDMDRALSSLDLGSLGTFLELRTHVLDSRGNIRKDCYEPRKIYLSDRGVKTIGLKINDLLKNLVRPTQVQIPPAAVSIPHPEEAELARIWLAVRGYPMPPPLQPQPAQASPPQPLPSPSQLSEELAGSDQLETDVKVPNAESKAGSSVTTIDDEMKTNTNAAIVSNDDDKLNLSVSILDLDVSKLDELLNQSGSNVTPIDDEMKTNTNPANNDDDKSNSSESFLDLDVSKLDELLNQSGSNVTTIDDEMKTNTDASDDNNSNSSVSILDFNVAKLDVLLNQSFTRLWPDIRPALRPHLPQNDAPSAIGLAAGPMRSDLVQAAPIHQVAFVPVRASTPTPDLDATSDSIDSQIILDASYLLADDDYLSMAVDLNQSGAFGN
jgi:hypothetical protein